MKAKAKHERYDERQKDKRFGQFVLLYFYVMQLVFYEIIGHNKQV